MVTREGWATSFLKWAGFPHGKGSQGDHNRWALVAWMAAEGGSGDNPPPQARWNPLNTTWRVSTSKSKIGQPSTAFNWVGVQNYGCEEDGLNATLWTLAQKDEDLGFVPIFNSLKNGMAAATTLKRVEQSAWGTGGLALRILRDVKSHWDFYANKPIGQ